MDKWGIFLAEVRQHLDQLTESGCDMPFFRGHADCNWRLVCGLGRKSPDDFKKQNIESILYYDFLSLGGSLLGKNADSWDVLFAMQHHGLPTRLLDWTTTFSSALYFALRPYLFIKNFSGGNALSKRPCIWILDPFELNRVANRDPAVVNPYIDFEGTYQENFIEESKNINAQVLAINPPQHTPRQSAQRSVFTLHADLYTSLDEIAGANLKRFDIPKGTEADAISFLELAGVNEFTIFPDLDGLSRHLRREHVSWT